MEKHYPSPRQHLKNSSKVGRAGRHGGGVANFGGGAGRRKELLNPFELICRLPVELHKGSLYRRDHDVASPLSTRGKGRLYGAQLQNAVSAIGHKP